MGLTSIWTMVSVAVVALLGPLVWVYRTDFINLSGRARAWRLVRRWSAFVALQLAAVAVAALLFNDAFGFYASWSELFGKVRQVAVPNVSATGFDQRYAMQIRQGYESDRGTVVRWAIPGTASGVPAEQALVYLPAEYGDPAMASVRFPVVELLGGFPSPLDLWTRGLKVRAIVDKLIQSGRSSPFVAVMPTQNVALPRDTECVNVVGGPQVETYLVSDVRRVVTSNLRVYSQKSGWAIMGYSTGGYCALNLAMRHPDMYQAAASLSGYTEPAHDSSTGELFGRKATVQEANSPLWMAQHQPPAVSALLMTSRQDSSSYPSTERLLKVVRAPLSISTVIFSRGGHNLKVLSSMEPTAFAWLSQRLRPPLSPVPRLGNQ